MEHDFATIAIGSKVKVNEFTTKALAQRAARRRPTYIAQAVSYLISGAILALYAYVGTITLAVSVVYLICGITATATGLYLSETNFNDRFKDHYLTVPQTLVSMTIQLCATRHRWEPNGGRSQVGDINNSHSLHRWGRPCEFGSSRQPQSTGR